MRRLESSHGLKTKRTQFSPVGLNFLSRPSGSLNELEEFASGMFEVQDEASQLVALQVDCLVVENCDSAMDLRSRASSCSTFAPVQEVRAWPSGLL